MRRHAVDSAPYRLEDWSREDELLLGLPWLSHRDQSTLDATVTLEEADDLRWGSRTGGTSTDF